MNISEPNVPKKCIGRFPKRETNMIDIKSRNPLTKRSNPNLVEPYFQAIMDNKTNKILNFRT